MLKGLMMTWLLQTMLVAMAVVGFERQRSVNDTHRTMWRVAIIAGWIEEQWHVGAVAPSFGERFAMLVNAAWTAHKDKRCSRALEETKPLITEASERGIDHPQRRAMPPSITSSRSRARARRRTARGPPRASLVRTCVDETTIPDRRENMLREPTMEKLQSMRLGVMGAAWLEQQQNADVIALSFDERFAMLVDAEWMARENKRLGRALKAAKLRIAEASVEGIDYPPRRELDKAVVRQLGICKWIELHQVVIVSGATGTGKTYVSCALAQQACRKGYSAMYRRAPRFFDELRLARADGSYPRLLARIARVDVLVIDDFAIAPVSEAERRDLLEVLEDRYAMRATVISSQLPPERWHDYLADPTVADAICDRVMHGAHRIALKGPSRRKGDKDA